MKKRIVLFAIFVIGSILFTFFYYSYLLHWIHYKNVGYNTYFGVNELKSRNIPEYVDIILFLLYIVCVCLYYRFLKKRGL